MTFSNPLIYKGLEGLKNPNNINNIKRHGGTALKSARLLQWGRKRAYRKGTEPGPGGDPFSTGETSADREPGPHEWPRN